MGLFNSSNTEGSFNKDFFWGLFFVVVVCGTFSPVLQASYMMNFDDNVHLFYNSLVRDGNWRTPLDIFFTFDSVNKTYVPLTLLTFFYENMFWGLQPWISHAINVILHLAVCSLVFVTGRALGLTRVTSYVGALLFAIHPLHVEPVAWVTARKDLLCSFFYLASVLSYIRYLNSGKGKDYIFALISAGLAVLSKPMGLSLPLVLFLVDWYRSRSFSWSLLIEKIPFLLVVQPVALITYAMNSREINFSWFYSPLLWVWCASFYIQKFLLPFDLAVVYGAPLPVNLSNSHYWAGVILVASVLVLLWFFRNSRIVVFSVGFYVLSLFYIWRFDFYDLTFVADRFMYLPSMGFCFLFGIIVDRILVLKQRRWFYPFMIAGLISIMILSYMRASVWKNTYTLWLDNLRQYQSSYVINAYGESLLEPACFKDNREDFIRALSKSLGTSASRFKEFYSASLNSKVDAARRVEALKSFNYMLKLNPNDMNALENIGLMYTIFKQYEKSLPFFDRIIILSKHENGEYFFERGVAYEYLGRQELALSDYNRAISLNNTAEVHARLNRANILMKRGALDQALDEVLVAVQKFPGFDRGYDLAIIIAQAKGDHLLAEKMKKFQGIFKKISLSR